MKNNITNHCQSVIGRLTNYGRDMKALFMLVLFTTGITGAANASTSPPGVSIVGPLTACATASPSNTSHDLTYYIQIARATSDQTMSYSFSSNSSGAFIRSVKHGVIIPPSQNTDTGVTVATGTGSYDIGINFSFDTITVFPGTSGFQFIININDTTSQPNNNTGSASLTVSVAAITGSTSYPSLACYGATTTLSVTASGASPDGYGFSNYYDSIYSPGVLFPNGVPGNPNPNTDSLSTTVATFDVTGGITYNVTIFSPVDFCTFDTVITIAQPAFNPVNLTCPGPFTEGSCLTQSTVKADFATWLATVETSGGTNPVLTADTAGNGAPSACGGTTTVTWTVTSLCQPPATCSATFTVSAPPALSLTCPGNATEPSCQSQATVNAEFISWLGGVTYGGGCTPVIMADTAGNGAPPACGGTTTVIWTLSTGPNCPGTTTCSATFSVTPTTNIPVIVMNPPGPLPVNPTLAQILAAFGTATATDGCGNPITPIGTVGTETGGASCTHSITKSWTATDACGNKGTNSQTLTFIRNTTPPQINCSPNTSVACNGTVTFTPPSATDHCDNSPAIIILIADNVVGNVHTRTWQVTDTSGLTATCHQSVTVDADNMSLSCSSSPLNGGTGSVTGTVSNATGTVSYTWSNGTTTVGNTATVSGLPAGTYTLTVTDACTSASCSETVAIACKGFRTETMGGWGTLPHGGNPGAFLYAHFAQAFPNGLTIGCTNTLTLTAPVDVTNFLPSGTAPAALPAGHLINPGGSYRNNLAGQIVAMDLAIGFDLRTPGYSTGTEPLIDLFITTGPFAGMTVGHFDTLANEAIGGCGTSGFSLSQFDDAANDINMNYDDGTANGNYLACTNPRSDAEGPVVGGGAGNNGNFGVVLFPNPFNAQFHIMVVSQSADQIDLKVFDMAGRLLDVSNGIQANQELLFGELLANGVYLIEVNQGSERKVMRIIKAD